MTRVLPVLPILYFLILCLLSGPGISRAQIPTYLVDLTGNGVVPPVETDGTGHIEARWASGFTQPWEEDALIIEVELEGLEGTPQQLRVYARPVGGEGTLLTTLFRDGVETGRQEIPLAEIEGYVVGPDLWFVLTTTTYPMGEIAGPLRLEWRIESCGWVHPDDECPSFLNFETWENWVLEGEVPFGEPARVYLRGEVVDDDASQCNTLRNLLRIVSMEECESEDFGGGRYYVDEYDGCNVWNSPRLGRFRTRISGAASGDSVQVWGVRHSGAGDVCVYGIEMIDVDSSIVFPDTLTPVRSTSWGDLKRVLGR